MKLITPKLFIAFILMLIYATQVSAQSGFSDPENHYKYLKKKYSEEEFPNLQFIAQDGSKFDLKSLKGKVVVINYWAFGCKSCVEEIPSLNKLVDKFGESTKFLSILSPGLFDVESEFLISKLAKFDFNYQHVATDDYIEKQVGILAVFPTHLVIDKNGRLVELFWGVDTKLLDFRINESL